MTLESKLNFEKAHVTLRSLGRPYRQPPSNGVCSTTTGAIDGLIRLEDHSADPDYRSWAKDVSVDRWEAVGEGPTAFAAWHIVVQTRDGAHLNFWRRYSEFELLRDRLVDEDPYRVWMPPLPPKVVSKFDGPTMRARKLGLTYFLLCVLLDSQRAHSQSVKVFCEPS